MMTSLKRGFSCDIYRSIKNSVVRIHSSEYKKRITVIHLGTQRLLTSKSKGSNRQKIATGWRSFLKKWAAMRRELRIMGRLYTIAMEQIMIEISMAEPGSLSHDET
ncbi:MAG: hypothetical protein ACK5PS_13570 [Desulfopila sp.]